MHHSLRADSAGRLNLGKEYASLLFTVTKESGKIVLEPARIMTEKEIEGERRVLLSQEEWEKFEEYMKSDVEPTEDLKRLMRDDS